MSTITVPRSNVTAEKVCKVLRDGLGAGYDVVPGMAMARTMIGTPHADENTILVGKGSYRVIKAEIRMQRRGGETRIFISPGGVTLDLIINSLGIARKARGVLANSPELGLWRTAFIPEACSAGLIAGRPRSCPGWRAGPFHHLAGPCTTSRGTYRDKSHSYSRVLVKGQGKW